MKNRSGALLNVLADEIVSPAERQKLEIVGIAASTVKKRIAGHGRAKKHDVAEAVPGTYPELRMYLPAGRASKNGSWLHLFDAVAISLTVLQDHLTE